MSESGFLNHILSLPEAMARIGKVNGLFEDLKSLIENHRNYSLSDYLEYLDLLEEHSIFIKKEAKSAVPHSVRLMTAHKSKGLEFEYVFIIGVYDGHWGNKRLMKHFHLSELVPKTVGDTEDERRLFYVALTRAKTGVSISYSKEGARGELQLPSQFIEEIDKKYIYEAPTADFEASIAHETLLLPKKEKDTRLLEEKTFLNELFLEQGFSVTALNNYLTCPWNYFYSNLLRIPKAPTKHLLFGTAVHRALKDFFDCLKEGGKKEKKILCAFFEHALKEQPFSSDETYSEAFEKGTAALSGYFDAYSKAWLSGSVTGILNEFKVRVLLSVELADIHVLTLRGDLDKIELLGSGNHVNVVDYKTGKPKSRNVIEGKTKSSDGNYKRQLVFYKMLLDLFENKKYAMESGEIDFIEPDEKGRYRKERFEITDGEVEELKKLITKTAREILDLSFWDSCCDNKKCDYCALRAMMT